jgi:hypothetical protein
MTQNGHPPTRGFGRYQSRYAQIIPGLNQSLAQRDIGKVKIDCCYLEDSTCGTLEQNPAWLLYLDINIHQPRGWKLANASITLTVHRDTDIIPAQPTGPAGNPRLGPQVTKYFGPKGIQDRPQERNVNRGWTLEPNISVLGNSGGLGNISGGSNYVASSRWLIRGQWWPVLDEQLGVSLYRKVNWYMEENTFDEQTLHANSVHVGAVLRHDLDPIRVEVRIEGKLQGISGVFRFPPQNKPAVVISKFTPKKESKCLDNIAKALEDELTKKNQVPVPGKSEDFTPTGVPRFLTLLNRDERKCFSCRPKHYSNRDRHRCCSCACRRSFHYY